ncbi:MAG: phosphotriesterase-related protein [Thermodesulfobacteriota bacterium]
MIKINTVLGPISSEALGLTLVHEHIAVGFPGWECDPLSRPYDRKQIAQLCLKSLEPLKVYGVQSIIDATPPDLDRDVDLLKEISEKLQINIICSTGRYTEDMGKWAYLRQRSKSRIGRMDQELYEGFMQEITKGIGLSAVKPGVIKVATGLNGISPVEEALLRAAARAGKETGLPIITHTEAGTMGPEQAALLIKEGADPKRIMIGHMCGNPSLSYQMSVLSQGVHIAFDRFGLELFLPDRVRIAMLVGLLGVGYTDRIMMSQDFMGCVLGRGGRLPEEAGQKVANWSFSHIFGHILPALKQAGISDEQIRTMMIDNPRRLFSGE